MDVHRRSVPGQSLRFGDCTVTFIVDTSSAILGYEALISDSIKMLIHDQEKNVTGTFRYRMYDAGYKGTWWPVWPSTAYISSVQFVKPARTLTLCDAFQQVYQDVHYDERNVIVVIRLNNSDDSVSVSCERRTAHFLGHNTNQVFYIGLNHDTNVVASRYGVPRDHTIVCGVPTFHHAVQSCSDAISRLRVMADLHNARRAASVTAFSEDDRQRAFPTEWRGNKEFHNKIGKLDDFNNQVNWKLNALHSRFAL